MKEIECFPDPKCRCCVCQGKFCLVDHPGHWHEAYSLCNCYPWDGIHATDCPDPATRRAVNGHKLPKRKEYKEDVNNE